MLVFELIGPEKYPGDTEDTSWMKFLYEEVIIKNGLLELFDKTRPKIIKSASRVMSSEISEEEKDKTSVLYELEFDPNTKREAHHGSPLVKIYTTMPGALVDDLRSRIKAGVNVEKAVESSIFLFPRLSKSQKKKNELTALARIFSKRADGFDYLIIKC